MFYFFYKRESTIQVGFRDNQYGRCKKVETGDQKKLINLKWGAWVITDFAQNLFWSLMEGARQ